MARKKRTYRPGEIPTPLRWRPRMSIIGVILGAIGGLGAVVYIQQAGWRVMDRALSLQGIIGGALSGILIPSIIYFFTVRRYNKRLAAFAGRRRAGAATAMLWLLSIPLVLTLLSATPAVATVEGPCTVTINGIDISGLQPTAADAIVVGEDDTLVGQVSHPSEWQAGSIDMHYAGFVVTIVDEFDEVVNDEDAVDTGASVSQGSADVADLATYGTGVYAFYGAAVMESGAECSASFAIKLDKPPLETVAGVAAAATAAVGAVTAAGVAINGIREGSGLVNGLDEQLSGLESADTYSDEEIGSAVMDALEDLPDLGGGGGDGGVSDAGTGLAESGAETGTVATDTTGVTEAEGAGLEPAEAAEAEPAAGETDTSRIPGDESKGETPTGEPDTVGSDGMAGAEAEAGGDTGAASAEAQAGVDVPADEAATGAAGDTTAGEVRPGEVAAAAVPAGGWASAEDGSDFLGRDTADSVSSGIQALNDAGERLDGLAEDLGVPDDIRDQVKDRLQPIGDRLGTIKDNADLYRDTIDRAGEISDDVTSRLGRLGVNERGQDAITWMRWMFEGVGNYVEGVKNEYMRPFTERLASVFGGEADDYASQLVPVGDFGREMGEFVTTAAENVKGGDNYAGQLRDLANVPPDDPFAGIDEVFRFP